MLQIQAEDYWRIERRKQTNSAYAPAIEDYQGTAVYLMGMSYFEREGEFQQLNQNLHKVQIVSRFAEGLSKLTTTEVGGVTKVQPGVDMLHTETAIAGNRTVHPDSREDRTAAQISFLWLDLASSSAEEHAILNQFFGETKPISTVKLLQLAQQRAGPSLRRHRPTGRRQLRGARKSSVSRLRRHLAQGP